MTIRRRSVLRGLATGTAGALASSALARAASASTTAGTAATGPASAAADDAGSSTKAVVTAADGAQWDIDGVNVFRGAGVLVQFTPDYGFTTFTNQWGAEAALVPTGQPTDAQLRAADQQLQAVTATVTREAARGRIKPPVKDALTAQIAYCRRIVGYAVSRHMR